jgi:hypothetical protein
MYSCNGEQINVDEPHIHVRVTATAMVFGPRNGMVLRGKVTEACATHLSVLAYGVFNATLPRPKSSSNSSGSVASAWEAVEVGSVVRFNVLRMQHAEGLLAIEGALEKVLAAGELDDDADATSATAVAPALASSKKTKKRSLETVTSPSSPTSGVEASSFRKDSENDAEGSKKKKKKRDRSEDANDLPSLPGKSSSTAAREGAGSKGSAEEGDHSPNAESSGNVDADEEAKKLAKRGRKKAAQAKKKAEQAAAK